MSRETNRIVHVYLPFIGEFVIVGVLRIVFLFGQRCVLLIVDAIRGAFNLFLVDPFQFTVLRGRHVLRTRYSGQLRTKPVAYLDPVERPQRVEYVAREFVDLSGIQFVLEHSTGCSSECKSVSRTHDDRWWREVVDLHSRTEFRFVNVVVEIDREFQCLQQNRLAMIGSHRATERRKCIYNTVIHDRQQQSSRGTYEVKCRTRAASRWLVSGSDWVRAVRSLARGTARTYLP